MKKLLSVSLLILFAFNACDDIPSDVIDSSDPDYNVVSVEAPTEVVSALDSVLTTTIEFKNTSSISSVWFNIVTEDGTASIKTNIKMLDNGNSENGDLSANDGKYSAKTILGESVPSGKYVIEYYVENNIRIGSDKVQMVSSHNLSYISSKDNVAPVISNLVAPDTVVVQAPKSIILLELKVEDENGLADIKRVSFISIAPDTTVSGAILMLDNGNSDNGDATAGDGIYSRIIEVTPINTKGDYRFEFTAEDRSGAISNKIIHTITIK